MFSLCNFPYFSAIFINIYFIYLHPHFIALLLHHYWTIIVPLLHHKAPFSGTQMTQSRQAGLRFISDFRQFLCFSKIRCKGTTNFPQKQIFATHFVISCQKLHFYLRISKLSSTFAPAIGFYPVADILVFAFAIYWVSQNVGSSKDSPKISQQTSVFYMGVTYR